MKQGDNPASGASLRDGVPPRWGRWAAALGITLLLAGVTLARDSWAPLTVLEKGSVARHTVRATHDAVYDLHQTYAEEAEEAKQSYVPIYEQDAALMKLHQRRIVAAALARPLNSWGWPAAPRPAPPPRPDLRPPAPPSAATAQREAGSAAVDMGSADASRRRGDARTPAARRRPDVGVPGKTPPAPTADLSSQRKELEALVRGCFLILRPFFDTGVVADNEFPSGRSVVRVKRGKKVLRRPVSGLHRFSDLRPALTTRAARFFFKSDATVRGKVIEFVLSRLPANVVYSRVNQRYITDISEVTGIKVMLIRRGDILLRRGQVVDTRAYYAVKASVQAAAGSGGVIGLAARLGLLLAILLLFVVAAREVCGAQLGGARPVAVIYGGMLILAAGGAALLLYLPVPAAAVPQAALALTVGVVLGRAPGLLTGVALPLVLMVVQVFDLASLLVSASGGVSAALLVRRRRRSSVLPAAVLAGLVQVVVHEACRAMEGRPRPADELWDAGAVFAGAVAAGALALPALPLVEWFLGRSSRGRLKQLTDLDHPLVRELREKAPGTFSHTVNLISMVELAVEAVGGDRLLSRAGTLFHDIGKMAAPQNFIENQGVGPNVHDELTPRQSAEAIRAHVVEGLEIAHEHGLPEDVVAFIPQHHGTTGMDYFIHKAREAGDADDLEAFHYPGPRPQRVETAILMIADSIEAAARTLDDHREEALAALVDRIVLKKFSQMQFEECPLTQGQLTAIKKAFVGYLQGMLHRRVAYPEEKKGEK